MRIAPMQGFVDTINVNFIAGWTFNPMDEAPVAIQVVIGGAMVATTMADMPRPDIERSFGRARAGFRANLDLSPEMRAAFAPEAVRVYGLSDDKWHPIPRPVDQGQERAIEIDDMGSGFWMFGENLFRTLVVDIDDGADEIVAISRDDQANCRLTLKSGRIATVRPDEKIRVVPETFQDMAGANGGAHG
jgi:hypothetical protein